MRFTMRRTKWLGDIYKRWHYEKYVVDIIMHWIPGARERYVFADVIQCANPCLADRDPYPYKIWPNDFEKISKYLADSNQPVPKEIEGGETK